MRGLVLKKRAIAAAILAAMVAVVWVVWGRLSTPSLTFDQLGDRTGGVEFVPVPARALSYGWSGEPPTADGASHTWKEPLTDEITALLETSRYRRARNARPSGAGVIFQRCEGCVITYTAYWDGNALWVPGKDGRWNPYVPTAGFEDAAEQLLNTN